MRNIIVEYFVYKILAHENFTYKLSLHIFNHTDKR